MDLQDAFVQLRSDRDLTRQFTEDPGGVLSRLGVDTTSLIVREIPGGNAPYDNFTRAIDKLQTEEARPTICVSVGCVVCVSSG